MLFSKYTIAISALASGAFAKDIPIEVGKGGLTFSPNNVTAAVGDNLVFSFFAANHTATQGSFASPCQVGATPGAFFSGFMPTTTESNMTFTVAVNNTTPMWIFCSQAKHCQAGMSMVVNEVGSSAKTLEAYQLAAKTVVKSDIPTVAGFGGILAANSSSSGSGTSSGTSTSSSTASGTSSTAATKSSSAAGNVVVSPLNMVAAGAAAIGAFAFSVAL